MSAPTAQHAQQNPPTPSPLLRLPPEVRRMIFKDHLLQAPQHPAHACSQPNVCQGGRPGIGCAHARFNGGVPVSALLQVAQCIYQEAAPLYTRYHAQEFADIAHMGRYLTNIGPHLRYHIHRVKIVHDNHWTLSGRDAQQAFQRLCECHNLRTLDITFYAHHLCRRDSPKGLRSLLKLRNITNLTINYRGLATVPPRSRPRRVPTPGEMRNATRSLTQRLQVLYSESTQAENVRRGAADQQAGIIGGMKTFSLPDAN